MTEFLIKLFSSDFMPHGYCYLWNPKIVWLHAFSDGLIAVAYYFIPVMLIYFVRGRRDLPFHCKPIDLGPTDQVYFSSHRPRLWSAISAENVSTARETRE